MCCALIYCVLVLPRRFGCEQEIDGSRASAGDIDQAGSGSPAVAVAPGSAPMTDVALAPGGVAGVDDCRRMLADLRGNFKMMEGMLAEAGRCVARVRGSFVVVPMWVVVLRRLESNEKNECQKTK